MTIYTCPKGHDSVDSDYCSECGAIIHSLDKPIIATNKDSCPNCGANHTIGMRFCEVCRYDYDTSTAPSISQVTINPTSYSQPTNQFSSTVLPLPDLKLIITNDRSLYIEDSETPFPENSPDRIFHLDLDENLIGRVKPSKNINPEIPINDPGVSHRHLKIIKDDNSWQALELGSANGTRHNGQELMIGVPVEVKSGDFLTLGMWTKIQIQNK